MLAGAWSPEAAAGMPKMCDYSKQVNPPCIGGMGSTFRPKMPFFETYCALRDRDGSAKVENKVIMMVYITTDHRDLVLTVLAGGG